MTTRTSGCSRTPDRDEAPVTAVVVVVAVVAVVCEECERD